jgi:hypothetical protein
MEAPAGEVFVGRAGELGRLERALEAARAGSGSAALVAGEAGIGKTRLASELAARARDAGFEVLLGRAIDLVGTELPYQPFLEALRPLGPFPEADGQAAASQLRVLQETAALLFDRAATTPLLLVLEDLHWADTSILDLVVFLAHNLHDRRVLLLATYRADELSSAERVRRLAGGVRRSGSALLLELGPLGREEVAALLAARAETLPPAALTEAIVARADGNPFYAEELLAAADQGGALPRGLRDLLLQRTARLEAPTQDLLRLAAASGRDVGYPLLRSLAALPEPALRESLRRAVEHGVLVAEQASGGFRFRHALLAEAVYATILPGEREELHARLARELARGGAAAAELAPHWAAAGRGAEALAASVEAARQAEAVFGLAEAHAHLERALALWPAVPGAAELVRLDLAGLCSWAAELAGQTGAAPRAVELAQRAVELAGEQDPRAPRSCTSASGSTCTPPAPTRPAWPRSSAGSSSSRPSLPRRRGRARSRRTGPACTWPGATTSRWPSPSRRSRSRSRSARTPPRCGLSPRSAASSPTSATATKASPASGGPCGSPRSRATRWRCNGRTSRSPTC